MVLTVLPDIPGRPGAIMFAVATAIDWNPLQDPERSYLGRSI